MGRALAPDYRTDRAVPGDAAELAAFIWATWNAVDRDSSPFAAVSDDWIRATASIPDLERRLENDGGTVIVARAAQAIVGVAALQRLNASAVEITEIVVHPVVEQSGVGASLLDAAIRTARRMKARRIFTTMVAEESRDFFIKRGFHVTVGGGLERSLTG